MVSFFCLTIKKYMYFVRTALFLFLFPLSLYSQIDSIKASGLISVNIDSFPSLRFYSLKNANEPYGIVKIYDDRSINAHNFRVINKDVQLINENEVEEWFKPFAMHLDYYIFYLQVVKIENDWVQVIINEDSNLKLWLKKTASLTYIDWQDFLLKTVAVRPKNIEKSPLLTAPKVDSAIVKNPLMDCLQAVSINGDWMQVKIEPTVCDRYEELKDKNLEGGYIRWKKDNKLLIDFFLIF